MVVGVINGSNNDTDEFGFVQKELENIKDVSRSFDESLFKACGVSNTVINYWKEIAFNPSYYDRFWLIKTSCFGDTYNQYASACDALISGLKEENEKIGAAVEKYRQAEDFAIESFQKDKDGYIFVGNVEFDDHSGGPVIMTSSFQDVKKRLEKEASDDNYAELSISRYPFKIENKVVSVDVENHCGEICFNGNMEMTRYWNIKEFEYDGMMDIGLCGAYHVLPHPFQKGDYVSFACRDELFHGRIHWVCRSEELDRDDSDKDYSDAQSTIFTLWQDDDGIYVDGHDHIPPHSLNYITLDNNDPLFIALRERNFN